MTVSKEAYKTLKNIQVRRKVERVSDDAGAIWAQGQCGGSQFKQVNRDRIAGDSFTRSGTHQAGDLLADPNGGIPTVFIPTADQVTAPFLIHNRTDSGEAGISQTTKRISVQVD